MVQFSVDSLTEFSNVRLTSILFIITIIVLRYTFFSSISNKIFSDSISTRRMLKMVPAECRDQNLISWDSSLEIGIDWVDSQHKVLCDIMNTIYKGAIVNAKSKKFRGDALFDYYSILKIILLLRKLSLIQRIILELNLTKLIIENSKDKY
ncbi:hypothetical protein GEMRC1_007149 [Eukaryota sp. GEM-RC1]